VQNNISVIIPAFNAEKTLSETLDSILAQTRKADEVIIVNDGSTDDTEKVASRHPLAPVIISTVNRGASAAINEGIHHSHGELLAFVDADDLWEANKLEFQENRFDEKPEVEVVLTHMEPFICSSVPQSSSRNLVFKSGPQPGYLVGTMLCHRDVFNRLGSLDVSLKTGYFIEWFDRAKTAGVSFYMLPDVLMKRRIRPGTLSQRTVNQNTLSNDFVEIARRSIIRKRGLNDGTV